MSTHYVLLEHSPNDPMVWVQKALVVAISSEQAVRKGVENLEPVGAEYVAVPERSWKPVKVRMEQVSRVVLGEAKEPGEPA